VVIANVNVRLICYLVRTSMHATNWIDNRTDKSLYSGHFSLKDVQL